jgi:hypothetical protein
MLSENNMLDDESLTPVGIFDDGRKEEIIVSGDDIWSERGYTSSRL